MDKTPVFTNKELYSNCKALTGCSIFICFVALVFWPLAILEPFIVQYFWIKMVMEDSAAGMIAYIFLIFVYILSLVLMKMKKRTGLIGPLIINGVSVIFRLCRMFEKLFIDRDDYTGIFIFVFVLGIDLFAVGLFYKCFVRFKDIGESVDSSE